jgi:hypothetical protein
VLLQVNSAVMPVTASTASSGPGSRGHRHATTNKNVSVTTDSSTVSQLIMSSWVRNDLSSPSTEVPVTCTPVTLPSCPTIMMTAMPAR